MPAKLSNAARHRKSLAHHSTLTHGNSSLRSPEVRSLTPVAISWAAPLRLTIRTGTPNAQKSPAFLTKFPASPAKNPSRKQHAKLKQLHTNKFRIGSMYKLL